MVWSRMGGGCAMLMVALYLFAPGWTTAHLTALTPLLIPGAIWVARTSSVDGD